MSERNKSMADSAATPPPAAIPETPPQPAKMRCPALMGRH
jgi:hypothetical protein